MYYKKNIVCLVRFLFVYKEGQLTEAGQRFIDYILSEEGQQIVAEAGAIP